MTKQTDPNIYRIVKARLSFPHIFTPVAFDEADPTSDKAYEATFLLDSKAHATFIKQLEAGIERLMLDTWKKRVVLKHPLIRDGNEKPDIEGYGDGVFFLKAKNSTSPEIVDRNFTRLTEADKKFYAGCYVNASIRLYPWGKPGGKYGCGISASLRAIQFHSDGESLGSSKVNLDAELERLEDDLDAL